MELPSPDIIAKGYATYGPWVWTLSLALVSLATVSVLLLRAKNREVDRAEKRVDELTAQLGTLQDGFTTQLVALQERRIADRDAFQGKMDALARETNDTQAEMAKGYFELARAVQDKIPEPKKRALPKDDPVLPSQAQKGEG